MDEDSRQRRDRANGEPILRVAGRLELLGKLRRAAHEMVGPCPDCGGEDRFSISEIKNVFNCRRCGAKGGPIDLVKFVNRCEYGAAVDWLLGERAAEVDPKVKAEREAAYEAARKDRERAAERYRKRSLDEARAIWRAGLPAEDTPVRAYLEVRGISRAMLPALPRVLRYHPDLPYFAGGGPGERMREIHRGPAMLAVMQGQPGRGAVHRTWLDLSQPKGKALLRDGDTVLDAKKMWGPKKGCAIRLCDPEDARVLVAGEGIETTLTARGGGNPGWAYWALGDLGNMSGLMRRVPGLKWSGLPDMSDAEAWVPPDRFDRIIFIQDGDSDPKQTRAKLLCGLRRAMALKPGRTGAIVHPGTGRDLNDVLMEVDEDA